MNLEMWLLWYLYWLYTSFFTQKTKVSEGWLKRAEHVIPFYIWIIAILHDRHYPFSRIRFYDDTGIEAIGDVITFCGLAFTVWARVHLGRYWSGIITLKEGHKLIRSGPYAMVRHPIYTGLIVAAIGTTLANSTGDALLAFPLVAISFVLKSRREEAILTGEFGGEYDQFKHDVPALVPYSAVWRFVSRAFRPEPNQLIDSEAFAAAALRSEQYRITGILLVIAFLVAILIGRSIVDPKHHDYQRVGTELAYYFFAAAYETLMLVLARKFERRGRPPHPWVWTLNTIVECSLPTVAIFGLTFDTGNVGPYEALVSSQVYFYCIFIILGTLRLRPALCALSGFVSAAGYMGVFYFTKFYFPHIKPKSVVSVETFYLSPLMLLGAGVVAAGVAVRLRSHVIAALKEAETRRKLDRIEYDLNVARKIQMGLLPRRPPSVAGYDIAGFSQPADQTGGDYYDWVELPGGRIVFTIADATGHGIGPALLIAACRAYFRAIAMRDDPLEKLATQLDELLSADITDGRFITAAVGLLDPQANRLSLYSAGQGPIYFYDAAQGCMRTFGADQPPLGLCQREDGAQAKIVPLSPGDALVLVTDGFFEYGNASGEHFGSDRLCEALLRNHSQAAAEMIRRLHQEVTAFAGSSPQMDDVTAVVVKRT